jgi:mRNA deadenylase 3'-5' endonuclease subunit Ccr4
MTSSTSSSKSLNVVTYNVLAPKWLIWQQKEGHGYDKIDLMQLEWPHRFANLSRVLEAAIRDDLADVFALQEMQDTRFDDFLGFFRQHGFSGVFQETDNKYPIGAAFFWRESTLKLKQIEHRSRSIVACFEHNNELVFVANCHLEANKPDLYNGSKRLEQVVSTLKRLTLMIEKEKATVESARVVFCGDLNCLDREETYKFLAEGALPALYEQSLRVGNDYVSRAGDSAVVTKKAIAHPFKFLSAFAVANNNQEPPYTFVGKDGAFTLDYVFVANFTVERTELLTGAIEEPPPYGQLPNDACPSDHLGLKSRLH